MKARDVFPGVFSRHARAYRDRVMGYSLAGRRAVVDRVMPRPGDRILDLACGPGTLTLLLAERVAPGGSVVAADLAEGMLELVREAAPSNVEARLIDLESIDFADAGFDAVTCGHGYQFASDLDRALQEARRVLKPGGRFAASVPDGGASRDLRGLIDEALAGLPPAPSVSDRDATMEVIRDARRLAQAVTSAGFTEVTVTRHAEVSRYEDADTLTDRTFSWWDCAWRLEQLDGAAQALVRDRYRSLVTNRIAEWPLEVTSHSLVVSARA